MKKILLTTLCLSLSFTFSSKCPHWRDDSAQYKRNADPKSRHHKKDHQKNRCQQYHPKSILDKKEGSLMTPYAYPELSDATTSYEQPYSPSFNFRPIGAALFLMMLIQGASGGDVPKKMNLAKAARGLSDIHTSEPSALAQYQAMSLATVESSRQELKRLEDAENQIKRLQAEMASIKHQREERWERTQSLRDAIRTNDNTLAKSLVLSNLPIENIDSFGSGALHLATVAKNEKFVDFLLGLKQVNIQTRDRFGRTALHTAVSFNRLAIVDLFTRKAPILVNAPDASGDTPLHIAYAQMQYDTHDRYQPVVESLLKAGADPRIKNKKGLTPEQVKGEAHEDEDRVF